MDWKACFIGKKILVADDDAINREMMGDIFAAMQCQVEYAADGVEAIAQYKKGKFDLILMDIRMPNKSGIEATREIRALENGSRHTPIMALTASLLEEDRQECLKSGVDDFVLKPIHLEDLRQRMAKAMLEAK